LPVMCWDRSLGKKGREAFMKETCWDLKKVELKNMRRSRE